MATTYAVTCSERGSHDVAASVSAAVDEGYVEELAPGDEQRSATDAVDVFQAADLAVGDMSLVCSQREASRADFRCTAQMTVTNLGPAGNVRAAVRLAAVTPSGCTLDPSGAAPALVTLGTGQSTAVNRTWRFVCAAGKVGHSVLVTGDAAVAPDDGYAEDRAAGNDASRLLWQPSDAKPHPGAAPVKVTKVSELPFAVLSTATVSAVADVDPATLRFGVTGAERSVLSCTGRTRTSTATAGRPDCVADPALTGITCATTTATVSGYLRDGTPFTSQDDITVAGCKTGPTKGTAATTLAATTKLAASRTKACRPRRASRRARRRSPRRRRRPRASARCTAGRHQPPPKSPRPRSHRHRRSRRHHPSRRHRRSRRRRSRRRRRRTSPPSPPSPQPPPSPPSPPPSPPSSPPSS